MNLFPFGVLNHVLFGLFLMGLIKLYLIISMGVCMSTKRLDGKTVVITGGNTGIGKETALDLAKRGARVILACRNLKKAAAAKMEIVEKSGNNDVTFMELDLASLASVRNCATAIIKNEPKLHILINNAGCSEVEKTFTKDGLDHTMQTNHFGHFLLTNLLLGLMIKTSENEEDVRIVIVSSVANNFCKDFCLDDLNFTRYRTKGTLWSAIKIYGASKICNNLFTIELANKLKNHGKAISVNSLHPGAVHTEFSRSSVLLYTLMKTFVFFLKNPKEGAQTTVYLAVADEVANLTGKYFSDCRIATPSKLAQDVGMAKKLWEVSETLVDLKPEEKYF